MDNKQNTHIYTNVEHNLKLFKNTIYVKKHNLEAKNNRCKHKAS